MNVFIDTNVLLSFYHLSSDDLEELNKLAVLIQQNKLKFYLPEQVYNEFLRNRAGKIADALERFRAEKLNDQFPQICKQYPDYEVMRAAIRQFQEAKSKLLDTLRDDIGNDNLKADKIINKLFSRAEQIPLSNEILTKARLRMECGNPPGKKGSLGDRINWESLIQAIPSNELTYFISDDRDYFSEIDQEQFSPYLQNEWYKLKKVKISFYKRLSSFFKEKFPDIKLATELEKELLIQSLAQSPRFSHTRSVLNQLIRFTDFTDTELNDIVAAVIGNNQVYWIIGDKDINQYVRTLITGKEDKIEPKNLEVIKRILEGGQRYILTEDSF